MLNKKTFAKLVTRGNDKFYFKFIGLPQNDSIDYDKLNNTINNCFNNSIETNDIKEKISWIRTIFKDFEEIYLEINLHYQTTCKEKIIYKNKNLNNYQKSIDDQININYNLETNPNLFLDIANVKLNNYHSYKIKSEITNSIMEHLYSLVEINKIELTTDEKALCIFYKAFYGEYPNFSNKDINIKMQVMMSILTNFGICLDDSYSFMLNSKKFPISIALSKTVHKLKPFGKIENLDNMVRLDEILEQDIKTIGKIIKKHLSNTTNELECLKKLSTIFYTGHNCLPTNAAIVTISEHCKISIPEVESSLKLVKKIKKNILD